MRPLVPRGSILPISSKGGTEDDALTKKFDFASETMPAAGLTLYAKWAAPDQTATTHLSMAVSGSDTVSFDVAYGSKVDPAHMPTVKDSSGNVVSQGDDSLGVVTMPANTEWAGWATREDDCFVMFNFDSEDLFAHRAVPILDFHGQVSGELRGQRRHGYRCR